MEWMFLPLKRYAQFSGRSRRMEYWMWILFTVLAGIVLGILDAVLGFGGSGRAAGNPLSNGLLGNIFSLATLLPSLTVAVRRLHDTNRSGWWILLPVVPAIIAVIAIFSGAFGGAFAGGAPAFGSMFIVAMLAGLATLVCSVLLLVWYCTAGTDGPNDYGDDPKSDIPTDLAATFE